MQNFKKGNNQFKFKKILEEKKNTKLFQEGGSPRDWGNRQKTDEEFPKWKKQAIYGYYFWLHECAKMT